MPRKQRKIFKRRRREAKTNYKKRLALLKGGFLRFVVRKSNRYITLQIVESKHAQDKVLAGIDTKKLLKYGWSSEKKGSLKSLGAAYLGGFLLGKKIKDKIKGKIILDSGLIPSTKGSRIYAAVKGFKDAGIEISCGEEVMPSIEKIEKEKFFNEVKKNIESNKFKEKI